MPLADVIRQKRVNDSIEVLECIHRDHKKLYYSRIFHSTLIDNEDFYFIFIILIQDSRCFFNDGKNEFYSNAIIKMLF
jgi:predicted metallo-beta-lactamase superfamily hydrolase